MTEIKEYKGLILEKEKEERKSLRIRNVVTHIREIRRLQERQRTYIQRILTSLNVSFRIILLN